MPLLKPHFDTLGPFGLPMKAKQAKSLEAKLKDLPKDDAFTLRRLSLGRGPSELSAEGRCDVSWITEEAPDRLGDIVLSQGMDDSHFRLNPIVTLNHEYDQPPVGRSLWRRRVREGSLVGVKAKTYYPRRPETWTGDWRPDYAFELVKAGLLVGKSIGFIPLKMRTPSADEVHQVPAWKNVRYIIEEWLLAEYACCFLPIQPHAVVEQVDKAVQLTGPDAVQLTSSVPSAKQTLDDEPSTPARMSFVTLEEIYRSMRGPDLVPALEKALLRTWQKSLRI